MVQKEHRGRFATGCLTCRERKIKCDEARPSCSRCIKGRYTCPGYKKLTDLIFRNQNVIIARIASSQQAEKVQASCVGTSKFQASVPSHSLVPKPYSPSRGLNLDLESVARAHFLSCHVIICLETLARGQYEYLPDLLAKEQHLDPALHHSLNAAAFAALGNTHQLVDMLHNSRVECNLAIQAVNTALRSPETAAKDSTVVATMLLWTFETLTFVYKQDIKECIDQLTGGLALLMLRGPKQFETPLGFQVFLQAYFLVVSTCITKEHTLPPPSSMLRYYAQPYLNAEDCAWRILDLMARFADLLDAEKDQGHQTADGHLCLVSAARELDDDFQAVLSCMPPNWQYQTFQSSDQVLVYNSTYHIYNDVWTIRYWNYVRLCRIRLQMIILDNRSDTLGPSSLEYQTKITTISQLSIDICATVPQHAGYIHQLQPSQMGSQSSSSAHNIFTQPEVGTYTAGIYSLLHPLFAVGIMKEMPIQQKEWIISRLECLGRISGISQATAAAEMLKANENIGYLRNI